MKTILILSLLSFGFGLQATGESSDLEESMAICVKLEKESQVQLLYTSLSQVQDFMREQAIFKVFVRDCSNVDNHKELKWLKYSLKVKDKYIKEMFKK